MTEHEPPPKELRELLDAERAAPTIDQATRAAMRSRLAAAVGSAPLGHAAAGAALGGAGKLLAILAITVAAGGGTLAVLEQRSATHAASVEEPAVAPRAVDKAPRQPAIAEQAQSPAPTPPMESAPQAPRHVSPRVTHASSARPDRAVVPQSPSQAMLLRDAWNALSAGDPQHALELAEEDGRLHPTGALLEERGAVTVLALAKLRRVEEAHAAAAQFMDRYPSSVHRTLVERTLKEQETRP